jgi:hypothetical protein
LQGNEDIVNTERERSARAKRYARMHQKVSGRIAMRLQNVVARAARVTRPQAPREGFQESMLDQWTTGQLFYDADRLDDAIDLFAACSDAPLQGGAIA